MFSFLDKISSSVTRLSDGLTWLTSPFQSSVPVAPPAPPAPVPKKVLEEALFKGAPPLPKTESIFSGHSVGCCNMNMNYPADYRVTVDLLSSIFAEFPSSFGAGFTDLFSRPDMGVVYHANGIQTGLNTAFGVAQIFEKVQATAFSDAIDDTKGTVMNGASVVNGGALMSAGVSFAAFRAFSLAAILEPAKALLGRISTAFVYAGLAFYAIYFAIASFISGFKLFEGLKFQHKLNKSDDLEGQVRALQKMIGVKDPAAIINKLINKMGPGASQELIKEALNKGKDSLRAVMNALEMDALSEDDLEKILLKVFDPSQDLDITKLPEKIETQLLSYGLAQKVKLAEIKKEQKMQRILDKAGFDAMLVLKNDPKLAERVTLGDKDAIKKAQGLVETIKAGNTSKLNENALLFGLFVLGVVAMVAAFPFGGPIFLIFAAALMVGFSLIGTGVDFYYLIQSYKGEAPVKHDKKMVIASMVLGVISLAITLGLMLSGVVSFGIVPLIIAIVFFIICMSQNGATLAIMNQIEKRNLEKTRQILLEAIKKELPLELIGELISKLPKEVQEVLKGESPFQESIRKVEEARKRRLEEMRKELQPYLDGLEGVSYTPPHAQTA